MSSIPSDLDAIRAAGKELGPWHLDVEIAPGLTTKDLQESGPGGFYDPRPGVKDLFTRLYPAGLDGRSAFDCACNNGAHLFALKELGAGRCYGSDARRHWIDQARFLLEHRHGPSDDMEFEVADLYELPDRGLEPFDIGIFAGVFYHLPDPMRGLQIAAGLTKEILFLSTVTRADHPDGQLVVHEESTTHELAGMHGLAFFPTGPKILARLLEWLGFPAVRCLNWWTPPSSIPFLDSVQLVAARDERLLLPFDGERAKGEAGMLMHLREVIRPRTTILMVCADDGRLVEVPHREVWAFPEPRDPIRPQPPQPNARALAAQLDDFRAAGAEYLVVPSSAVAWLETNQEFQWYLDFRFDALVRDPDSCILYSLGD